jgi:predicted sulfurtransferase
LRHRGEDFYLWTKEEYMKKIIWIMAALVLTGAVILLLTAAANEAGPPRMTAEELNAKLNGPDLVVLDVRSPTDWKASDKKIKGAVREDPENVQSWAGKYSKEKTLVLYCA